MSIFVFDSFSGPFPGPVLGTYEVARANRKERLEPATEGPWVQVGGLLEAWLSAHGFDLSAYEGERLRVTLDVEMRHGEPQLSYIEISREEP